jgi:hypothetical protein
MAASIHIIIVTRGLRGLTLAATIAYRGLKSRNLVDLDSKTC